METSWKGIHNVCTLVQAVTKKDIRFIDSEGHLRFQLTNSAIPAALQTFGQDWPAVADTLRAHSPSDYSYFVDCYGLEYVSAGYWKEEAYQGCYLIGPFLSGIPTSEFLGQVISANKLPIGERRQLQAFYSSLIVVGSNEPSVLGELIVNLAANEHVDAAPIALSDAEVRRPAAADPEGIKADIAKSQSIIELRYRFEKKMMSLISKGDKEGLAGVSREMNNLFNLPDRIPESPIRSAKNLIFVLNTICRMAAEQGGLHPVHVHHISEKFSIMIERATRMPDLVQLRSIIMDEYCDAVRTYSTARYGPLVKQAVEHITFHLEQPLTLQGIADRLHANASHLSRKFKQETGLSIIDFINLKRVEEAKLYLRGGAIPITEIALMTGFGDLNYFGRVFKKFTSMTPSAYVRSKRSSE